MDEPRDDVDIWLSERVKPLLPHPGTFERIKRRARRRKLGQAAFAAGAAAVIVAAAVTVPQLVHSQQGGPPPVTTSTVTPHLTKSASASPSATRSSPASNTTPSTSPPAVPGNFAVSSVTFVSLTEGWVIGQAGTPGQCGPPKPNICTSRAITLDGGHSWQGGPAPVVGPPNGGYGVSQIRSLDGANAWAFGPQLYATHDAGQHWTKIYTHGMRVIDLEAVNKQVFAVWAHCTGTGAFFAANCTSFSLYTSRPNVDQWVPVSGVSNLTSGTASSVQLVLNQEFGYLLAPDGTLYQGIDWKYSAGPWLPVSNSGAGVQACPPGPAQPDGLPSQGLLATTGRGLGLAELCLGPVSGGTQTKTLLYSPDGGTSWWTAGAPPSAGIATSLSGTPAGPVLVATTQGIDVSARAPRVRSDRMTWLAPASAVLAGGFSYVGMTNTNQGVAIPADQGLHAVWFTYDGGKTWVESPVR
jgi:hypothetical protein